MQNKKAIIVKRVSTTEQKRSSLSLVHQEQACIKFCDSEELEVIAIYEDVCSGKIEPEDRPGLSKALEHAKQSGAKIIVSKLDRLSRSVESIARLMNKGLPFIVVETPEATSFMLHIYSAVAQMEREAIGQRIKDALAVKKQQLAKEGKKLGNPSLGTARKKAHKNNIKKNREARAKLMPIVASYRAELISRGETKKNGEPTWKAIADLLNERKVTTSTGKKFSGSTVMQLVRAYNKDIENE